MKRRQKNLLPNIGKLKKLKTKGFKSLRKDKENLKSKPLLSLLLQMLFTIHNMCCRDLIKTNYQETLMERLWLLTDITEHL